MTSKINREQQEILVGIINLYSLDLSHDWPPLHYRPCFCHLLCRSYINGFLYQLRFPHVRPLLSYSSGIDAVVLYSPEIFEKADIKSDKDKLLATVAVGFTKTIFILVDELGRSPLLLWSVGGMIASLLRLAIGLTIVDHSDDRVIWALAQCILAFVATSPLHRDGPDHVGVQLGDISLEAEGSRLAMNRVTDKWNGFNDVSVPEYGPNHRDRGSLLFVFRACNHGFCQLLLHCASRDTREEP